MATACSVLVVDDDPGVGEAISSALGAAYCVQTATTATAALEAISSVPFDLVFLDHRLPDLPGTDVLRVIKRFFPSTLVILITGYGTEDVAVDAFRLYGRLRTVIRDVASFFAFCYPSPRHASASPFGCA